MIPINFTNVNIIDNAEKALVSFWAPWCSACKAQNKMLENITDFPEDILLSSIDIGENRFLAQKYAVANIPDLLLLKKGKTAQRFSGLQSATQLIHQLKKY